MTLTFDGIDFVDGNVVNSFSGIAGVDPFQVRGTFPSDRFLASFTDDTVTITYSNFPDSSSFGYSLGAWLIVSGLDWGGLGTLETADLVATTVGNLDASAITFDTDSFRIDLDTPAFFRNGNQITVEVTGSKVSAPATLGLLVLGLLGFSVSVR